MKKILYKSFYLAIVLTCLIVIQLNKKEVFAAIAANDYEVYYQSLFNGDWNKPGLYEKDGSVHAMPAEYVSTGNVINVSTYGAVGNNSSFDNTTAFKNAIAAASSGDTIYIPNGNYYFKSAATTNSNYTTHIDINKSNLTFMGESKTGTKLISEFSEDLNGTNSGSQTTVIMVLNKSNVVLKNFTVSSAETRLPDPDDSKNNNEYYKAPKNAISFDCNSASSLTSNIVVNNIIAERYRRMGVRIVRSRDVTVKNSTFQNAIDLAGGGHGYGVVVQGKDGTTDYTDTNQDPRFNVVSNNTFQGPYIRHGVLVQYYAHNNLITNNTFNNTLLDSIDLHGELEYSNEVSFNQVNSTRAGAGIGVGNTGATHSASGGNNILYKNVIDGAVRGIDVIQGSNRTIILENEIKNLTATNSTGINIKNGPETKILGNKFTNINNGTKSYGIKVDYVATTNPADGLPYNLSIVGNTFTTLQRGIYVEVRGTGFINLNNTFNSVSVYNFLDDTDNFSNQSILDNPFEAKTGKKLYAYKDTYITEENPTTPYPTTVNLKISANNSATSDKDRMVYMAFNTTSKPDSYSKVYLRITTKSQYTMPTIGVYISESYTGWTQEDLTWENALYHNPTRGLISISGDVRLFTTFTYLTDDYLFNTYYLDVTNAISLVTSLKFTLIFADTTTSSTYCEIYSTEHTTESYRPALIFA